MIAVLTTAAGDLVDQVEIEAPPPEAILVGERVFLRVLNAGAFGRVAYREGTSIEVDP